MKEFESIKKLYRPVQPTILPSFKIVSYKEILPDPALRNIIYCYWQLKTLEPLAHQFNYRVVADGCIDIFFNNRNVSESFIMGFCKEYTEFPLENTFDYVGIRFFPSMVPQLFRVNALELSNKAENLELVLPKIAKRLTESISPNMDLNLVAIHLDRIMGSVFSTAEFDKDYRFYRALHLILKNWGTIETESELDIGISPRQLRRIFNHYIGTTPKTFSKVVRFQNILNAKPSIQSLAQNKLFYDVGFYDQSHFIKDFKNFYGVTPTRAFR
ncbi:AraC family transcriptional regulator [Ulvibacterium sp.]|uniref:AraC family transcriptional regulator n=1 Tax=Ulvibacterium sp. TaxID=2665914 RepID=UPI003CC6392A